MSFPGIFSIVLPVGNYDLAATLTSGQAFRWRRVEDGWEGVIFGRWVRFVQITEGIRVEVVQRDDDWTWLEEYLQTGVKIEEITASFPRDEHLAAAAQACLGLRLLRQEPWECLASFILSSTKQIVQIQQIVEMLCERFGQPVAVPPGHPVAWSFPSAQRLATLSEERLRCCKMGFRAPYLSKSAKMIAGGELDLSGIAALNVEDARRELLRLPGVGRKIADCALLFAYGFQQAFPVDVWVLKALRTLYFPRRPPSARRLLDFTQTYFGPNAGYAQQYLFHYMRTHVGRKEGRASLPRK
ncbi:MAG TPA: DNA glycosylase [Verrucomicrobiae bacterium]|nr:DNA glycosylase [Verrucomicrobiae bacterium]